MQITHLPSTLVRVTSDTGLTGWGEVCPLGTTYLASHAGGARAALELLAPPLIGLDPTNLAAINDAMDATLMGYAYAKSPRCRVLGPHRQGLGQASRICSWRAPGAVPLFRSPPRHRRR